MAADKESDVVRVMRKFKEDLSNRELRQMTEMARAWVGIEAHFTDTFKRLTEEVERKKRAGMPITENSLLELQYYREMIVQVQHEVQSYAGYVSRTIVNEQRVLAGLAVEHAEAAINAAYPRGVVGSFALARFAAVESMEGAVQSETPLKELLVNAWPSAVSALAEVLLNSTAAGTNPRQTAEAMRSLMADKMVGRAIVIARTEQIRAYRDATYDAYTQSGMVEGFYRLAAHNTRTCMACLLLEGEFYPLSSHKRLEDHPQGRCTMVPKVYLGDKPTWESGHDWFVKQSEKVQRQMMGPSYYDGWKRGLIDLNDLPVKTWDDKWGGSVGVKSLGSLGLQRGRREPSPASTAAPVARPVPSPKPKRARALREPGTFTTKTQMEKWWKATYPGIAHDFAGTVLSTMNPTLKEFHRLAQKYPQVAARLEYVGTYRDKKLIPAGLNIPPSFDTETAHTTKEGRHIALNPAFYGHKRFFEKMKNYGFLSGWSTASKMEHTLTHEFGHVYMSWLLDQKACTTPIVDKQSDMGPVNTFIHLFTLLGPFRYQVPSIYSNRNPQWEAWAESFVVYEHKTVKVPPLSYADRVRKVLNYLRGITFYDNPIDYRDLPTTDEQVAAYREYIEGEYQRWEDFGGMPS